MHYASYFSWEIELRPVPAVLAMLDVHMFILNWACRNVWKLESCRQVMIDRYSGINDTIIAHYILMVKWFTARDLASFPLQLSKSFVLWEMVEFVFYIPPSLIFIYLSCLVHMPEVVFTRVLMVVRDQGWSSTVTKLNLSCDIQYVNYHHIQSSVIIHP